MSEKSRPTAFPTRQAAAVEGRSKRLRVTGKLRGALEAMIWEGLPRKEAAAKAGLSDASVRFAMRKPHVLAFHNAELANLRTSLRARNVHRLDSIADKSGNDMARVQSIKVLEQLKVAGISLDAIERDRDQLWAEATRMFRAGDAWWISALIGDQLFAPRRLCLPLRLKLFDTRSAVCALCWSWNSISHRWPAARRSCRP